MAAASDATTPATGAYDQILADIVRYVYDYEIQSPAAWTRAKACLIDSLGVALETIHMSPQCVAMLGPSFPGTSRTPRGFRLPGTRHQLDVVKGAFDMAALIRYQDHNDAFPGAEWGHPSDNLGAILAVSDVVARTARAEGRPTAIPTMQTVISALIKAYEVQGCFQFKNAFNKVGLDHTVLVKIASTAVSSWLLGLTREQATAAVSHAWADGHPLRVYRQSPNAGPRKGWAAGEACKQAVHLALLARSGQPGITSVLTAPKWGFYDVLFRGVPFELPQPFGTWVVENVLYKVNTAEGHGMTAIEAALTIADEMRARGFDPATDIARVHIRTQKPAIIIIDKTGPLLNMADRDHCLRYMVAVVLLKGAQIDTPDYADESPFAGDPRVEALRQRITMEEDPALTADYYDMTKRSLANGLTVTLTDGSVLDEVLVEYPQGHVRRADTLDLVLEKAKRNLALQLSGAEVERIMALYHGSEFDALPVDEFIDLFALPDE